MVPLRTVDFVTLDSREKQNSLLLTGPVIKCSLLYGSVPTGQDLANSLIRLAEMDFDPGLDFPIKTGI